MGDADAVDAWIESEGELERLTDPGAANRCGRGPEEVARGDARRSEARRALELADQTRLPRRDGGGARSSWICCFAHYLTADFPDYFGR